MREIDEIFIPLKKSHSGNIQQNVDDVVVLAFSSSRSDPIKRRKWRRLREMHMYSTPTTPPSRSSEIWWSGRWDRQHDGVVSMMESMRRQGFACLRGGRRTEKGVFKNRAAAPWELGQTYRRRPESFYRRLHEQLGVRAKLTCCPSRARCLAAALPSIARRSIISAGMRRSASACSASWRLA
jgi:hypothetical protein